MTVPPAHDIAQLVGTLAGAAIAAWGFWRVVQSPARGEWLLKLAVLATFCSATLWTLDRATGNGWRWDFPLLMASIAVYLWCGIWRHYRASRRRDLYMRPRSDAPRVGRS